MICDPVRNGQIELKYVVSVIYGIGLGSWLDVN